MRKISGAKLASRNSHPSQRIMSGQYTKIARNSKNFVCKIMKISGFINLQAE